MTAAWAPALDDVGRLVLTRTRDTKTPGADILLGTFTANTTPDGRPSGPGVYQLDLRSW